jgi:DNA-binding Lrp family transcriptional regulator
VVRRQTRSRTRKWLGPKSYGAELVEFSREPAFLHRRAELDDADLKIIDTLVHDGRANTRSMVGVAGLTEETVAARIRNLIDRGIIGITTIFDWTAAGYEWDLYLLIEHEGGSPDAVVEQLMELDGVSSIYVVSGRVDLVVHVLCQDREEMLNFLANNVPQIKGVRNSDVMISLDTVKYFHQFAWVPIEEHPLNFPNPVVELNELDWAIIDVLLRNGRTSNREIARGLDVSDGTVRAHLRRLEEAGLLRVCAQVHPARSGMVRARAFVGISIQDVDGSELATELARIAEIVVISITANQFDLFCYILAESRSRLFNIIANGIRPMKGVRSTETWEVIGGAMHQSYWARW